MKNLLKVGCATLVGVREHHSHILLNIQLSAGSTAAANIYCDFIYIRPRVCMITSLSLNRKTIDAVNLFHKLGCLLIRDGLWSGGELGEGVSRLKIK